LSRPDGNTFYGSTKVTSDRIDRSLVVGSIEAPITKTLDFSRRITGRDYFCKSDEEEKGIVISLLLLTWIKIRKTFGEKHSV